MSTVKRVFIIFLAVFLLSISGIYIWVSTRWKSTLTNTEMKAIANEINQSPDLPNSFYEVYDNLYPGRRYTTMNEDLFYMIMSIIGFSKSENNYCQCRPAFYSINLKSDLEYSQYFIGWGIEKYSSPKKCFDFNVNSFISEYRNSTNRALSEILKTPLEKMNEEQILEFYLLKQAPTSHNKYINPNKFKTAMSESKKQLNLSRNENKIKR